MALQSFQITLPSNSSAQYFPDNQANHFQVKLPTPIDLQGEWEAALIDIQFDNYWLYLEKPHYLLMWVLPDNEKIFYALNVEAKKSIDCYTTNGQNNCTEGRDLKLSRDTYRPFNSIRQIAFIFQIPSGFYESPGACLNEINNSIKGCLAPLLGYRSYTQHRESINLNFLYDPISKEIKTILAGFKKVQFVAQEQFLLNSLGFRTKLVHNQKPANLEDHDRRFFVFDALSHAKPNILARNTDTSLYISSDILKLQNYANGYEPLLGIVPILPQTSGQIYWKPTTPFYLSLKTNILDTIEIWIKNEKREPFPFKPQSKAILRLHFRRKQSFD